MIYLKTYEKYKHTQQDKIDDMIYIREFSRKFEEAFEYRLNLNINIDSIFRNFIDHGAEKVYTGEIILNNKKILSKKINIKYNIIIATDINPNGIKNENDIGRTFSINFNILKSASRNINNIRHFYNYSTNIDDLIQSFDKYLIEVLGIKYLTEDEKQQKKKEKDINKYNL